MLNMLERIAVVTVIALFFAAGAAHVDTSAPATPDPSTSLAVEAAQNPPISPLDKGGLRGILQTDETAVSVPNGYVYWKTINARVTAYEPSKRCCGRFADGKTATGGNAWKIDGCAAYPQAVPYGTLVHIPGVGFREVDDTGPAMRRSWAKGRYHIDIRMKYFYQARRWGRQNMDVKLYRKQV